MFYGCPSGHWKTSFSQPSFTEGKFKMKSDTIVEVSFRGDPSHWVPERVFNLGNGSSFVMYVMLRVDNKIIVTSVPA